jgi:hypothetical protein
MVFSFLYLASGLCWARLFVSRRGLESERRVGHPAGPATSASTSPTAANRDSRYSAPSMRSSAPRGSGSSGSRMDAAIRRVRQARRIRLVAVRAVHDKQTDDRAFAGLVGFRNSVRGLTAALGGWLDSFPLP